MFRITMNDEDSNLWRENYSSYCFNNRRIVFLLFLTIQHVKMCVKRQTVNFISYKLTLNLIVYLLG